MEFCARYVALLNIMLDESAYKPMNYFSSKLNVSPRTVYNDINNINVEISRLNVFIEKKQGFGIRLMGKEENKLELRQFINNRSTKARISSVNDRHEEILRLILIKEKTLTYQQMSDKFFVSKTSVAKDIHWITSFLNNDYNIIVSDNKGTRIKGTELQIQKALKKYTSYLLERNKKLDDRELFLSAKDILKEVYPDEIIGSTLNSILRLEETINTTLSDYYLKSLFITLIVFVFRLSKNKHVEIEKNFVFEEIESLKTYFLAKNLLHEICHDLAISYNDDDIEYINKQLIVHGIKADLNNEIVASKYKKVTEAIIAEMSTALNIDLTRDDKLLKGLLFHIVPMIYRLRMGIKIKNPLLEEIKNQYSIPYNLTWYAISRVQDKLDVTLTEDEVGFITVHFLVSIDKNTEVKKVLIVCPTGIGTSELIANKIKKVLPYQDIVEVVSIRKLYENDIKNVDLIISSVHLQIDNKPVVYVSPLITKGDLKNITSAYGNLFYDHTGDSCDICNYRFKHIGSILDKDLILTNCSYYTKEECISALINAFKKKNLTLKGFEESILDREALGSTALDSGVAVPHALPKTIKSSRIGIMTLKDYVNWDGKLINTVILIGIAEGDIKKVKDILSEIYYLVESKDTINRLLSGKSKNQIIKILNENTDIKVVN